LEKGGVGVHTGKGGYIQELLPIAVRCVLAIFFVLPTLPAAAGNDGVMRIGGTLSLAGKYREPSIMIRDAYNLWVQQVNRRGGLLGRRVELILYNDQSREDFVRQFYHKLLEEDRVDLLLSPYGSPLTLVASEVSEAHGYVMIACAAAAEMLWERGYHYLFGVYATASRYFIGLLDLMARHGQSSVAILYENSPFHRNIAAGAENWAGRFRLKVPWRRGFNDADTELQAAVKELKGLMPSPDGFIVSAYPPACYRLLDIMKAEQYRPRVLAMTIAPIHPDFHRRVSAAAEMVFAPSQWEPDERIPFPGTKAFVQEFKTLNGGMPSYHAGSAYAACEILEKAVTRTASLEQKKLRDYIASSDTVTVIGRFKVDSRGMQIGHNPILIQWQDGRKEIVYPTKMQTAKPRF
jgi:branched-chain amino acid transport system substrate-binding protein